MLSIGEKLTDLLPKQDFISGVADLEKHQNSTTFWTVCPISDNLN